jgi:hypothetical protein
VALALEHLRACARIGVEGEEDWNEEEDEDRPATAARARKAPQKAARANKAPQKAARAGKAPQKAARKRAGASSR